MRRYTTVLWLLPATVLLVLFASSVLGTPTRAAPQYNITPGTEPPTSTPTEPPPPSATATNTPGQPSVTPTNTPGQPSVTPTNTPGGPDVTPTNTPGGPSVTPTPPEPTGVLPPPPGRGDDEDDDEPGPTPDVGLFKQADTSSARPGAQVTYTITVMNRGTASAIDVVVTDNLPEGMEIGDVTATRGDVSRDGRSLTVRIGDMEPGETVTIVVRARVSETVSTADLRNNAVAESGPPEQRVRLEASVNVTVELTVTPTAEAVVSTPIPRSAPLPNQTTANNRLPRTGTPFADVFDLALLLVLAAGALFCLSMAARAYRRS